MKKNFFDGFVNLLKSFGDKNDTRTQTTYGYTQRISTLTSMLDDLYATSWIAAKIVDIPVNDAFKEGRTILIDDDTKLIEIEELYTTIDKKINLALKYARIYGGSALVIVSQDDALNKPMEQFTKGDLINIAVLDAKQLIPQSLDRNPLSSTYLQPESFNIVGTSQVIHKSRVIYVDGVTSTYTERELNNGFGSSIFERGHKNIEDAVQTNVGLRNLVEQSNLDVVGISDLNKSVADNQEKAVQKRIEVLSSMKSILNTIAIDSKDTYTNIAKNFGTLDKIQMNMFLIIAAAYDIPFTRFMGKSAEGMSATGDGDLNNYYDMVKADIQIDKLQPIYKIIDPIVTMHLYGDDSGFDYKFNPMYQLSELEEAELRTKNASTRASDLDRGIIDEATALKEAQKDGLYLDYDLTGVSFDE